MNKLIFGSLVVETSNEDKLYFPDDGITKGDLLDYYRDVADTMLPYLEGRPLTMHRFPDGIRGEDFYHKEAPDYFPDWIERVMVKKEGGSVHHVLVQKAASLVYIANQGCITPHVWLSRRDRIDHPDQLIFDLDPPGDGFAAVKHAARELRELLEGLGLAVFVKTTGSRGLHVLAPLDRSADFDTVRAFARGAARFLAARHPDRLTTEVRKEKRGGRLFLDTARNAYAQTAVAPYAVRALPEAPVAAPLDWDELGDSGLTARRYTLRNVRRRLGQREDPWKGMMRHAHSLTRPRAKLDRLLEDLPEED
jgi:bifunctional non-homologous end joining protein LigD